MKWNTKIITIGLFSSMVATPSIANETYYDFGFVGASAGVGQSVFTTKDKAQASAAPNLFYNGSYGFIDGSLVNVSIAPYVGISGQWRFAQVSDDVNDLPTGIKDRDGNGEIGLTLGTLGARLTFLHDITNEHKGYEVQLHLGRTFDAPVNDLTLTPYIEVDYRDKKLSQHLYSISQVEANLSGLKAFDAKQTWTYQAGVIGLYHFTPNWLGLAKLELEHHASSSGLVQRDLGWATSIGVVYKFTD